MDVDWRIPVIKQKPKWISRLHTDLSVLLHLFPWPIGGALLGGLMITALIFQQAYNRARIEPIGGISYLKAVYAVLNMVSFQVSYADMPPGPMLDLFFAVVPLIGIPLLLIFGARLLHILRVFFVRQERGQIWQHALASTIEQPVVICGLGHVGYRIADAMLELERPAVGIEAVSSPLVSELIARGLPVIMGDIRQEDVLQRAGADRARTVVVCTHDDIANIEAAFHVHGLNPDAEIVLRLFEDQIADPIREHFDVKSTLSRSALAAEAFAYAALGIEAVETFIIETQTFVLADVHVPCAGPLRNRTISDIASTHPVTVICVARGGHLIKDPKPEFELQAGDALFIFTELRHLSALVETESRAVPSPEMPRSGAPRCRPTLVCGIGHTGYRVVRALQRLEQPVIAMALEPNNLSARLQDEGVTVRYGDFRQRTVLEEADLLEAQAIIACAEDDMVNFETAIRARDLNPQIRIVMRIFEEALGRRLQQAFAVDAVYSTSAIAAPAFIAAALNIHLSQPILLGNEQLSVARIRIESRSELLKDPLDAFTEQEGITALLHRRDNAVSVPPQPQTWLKPGDEIVLLASWQKLRTITQRNPSN